LQIIFWMQIAVAFYGYFVLKQYNLIPQIIDFLRVNVENLGAVNLLKIITIWIYLFIPAFFIGGSFPLINGLYLESVEKGTSNTGLVYFWDTFGSILGAFLAGFFLLPQFGFRLTCVIAVIINLLIALLIVPKREWRIFILIFGLLIIVNEYSFYHKNIAPSTLDAPLPTTNIFQSQEKSESYLNNKKIDTSSTPNLALREYPELDKIFGDILFQESSPFGKITIGNNAFQNPENKVLFINYRDMCHSQSHLSESEMGSIVANQIPPKSRVLNIGFGCGFTADAIAQQPNVDFLDIAEINPVVIKGARQFFKQENNNVLENIKTNLHIEDGAEFIRNTQNQYNAIIIDIEEVSIIYSSPLYTKEYFTIANQKLKSDGVLALWAHKGNRVFEKIIYNTLKTTFKNVNIIIIDGFYTFYASNSTENLPTSSINKPLSDSEQKQIQEVIDNSVSLINTLDNKVLEKYFNTQSYFNLPTDYKEDFLIR